MAQTLTVYRGTTTLTAGTANTTLFTTSASGTAERLIFGYASLFCGSSTTGYFSINVQETNGWGARYPWLQIINYGSNFSRYAFAIDNVAPPLGANAGIVVPSGLAWISDVNNLATTLGSTNNNAQNFGKREFMVGPSCEISFSGGLSSSGGGTFSSNIEITYCFVGIKES